MMGGFWRRTDPDVTMETPEKDLQPGKDATLRAEQDTH